jgi:uncharacterized RDD family membrane protein YckC
LHVAIPAPLLTVFYGCYYTFFHFSYGQTPGKMMKGLVVLTNHQKKLTLKQSLFRWIYYLISLLPLGIGFWMASRKTGGETWHDRMAGTWVWRFVEW